MNFAYPPSEFVSDQQAVEGFKKLLVEGFENPEQISGCVKIVVPEDGELSFCAVIAEELNTETLQDERSADTKIIIPISTIHRIFKEFEYLDLRDPSLIGTIEFSGNLGFANHLAKCCLRPTNKTVGTFTKAEYLHAEKGYKDLREVDIFEKPSQRLVLEAIQASKPIVIRGLEPSPPCKDWTTDKLVEKYANAITRVRSATHKQTMADFIAELKEFEANPYDDMVEGFVKPYTEGATLPKEMWPDFGPLFFDAEEFIPPQLWLGSVPTHMPTSSLHRDPLTGFLLQVIGRKRLDLYSADQAPLLAPMKAYNNYQPCWFKPEDPDYELFPRAKEASYISVILEPGDLIVQPAGWFHQVYALDSPNMSVSYFWRHG